MVAASYLAYGGVLSVVRATDTSLKNATDDGTPAVTINSVDDYINKGYDESTITSTVVAARNPGSWANGLKVAIIDGKADQTLGVTTTNILVGYGITQTAVGKSAIGAGSTSALDGYFKGIVTEVGTASIGVKFLSHVSAAGVETVKDYQASGTYAFSSGTNVGPSLQTTQEFHKSTYQLQVST